MSFLKRHFKNILKSAFYSLWFRFIYERIFNFIKLDFFSTKRLSFEYNNSILQDGMGAQILRIISLKAISDELHCDFEPFKILNFDEAVFNNFDKTMKKEIINKWENLLLIKTNTNNKFKITINFNSSRIFWLYLIRAISKITFIRFKVKCAFPAAVIDKSSYIYENCRNYLNHVAIPTSQNKALKIVIHIRRGEVLLSQFKFRYLPFDYYENILSIIIPILNENKTEYNITVLLEKITNPFLSSQSEKVIASLLENPYNPNLLLQGTGDYLLVDDPIDALRFPSLASCSMKSNNDAFSDFVDMCNSDILVVSKSSFSFAAGLLNQRALKIFPSFWHSPPTTWVDADKLAMNAKLLITDLISKKF